MTHEQLIRSTCPKNLERIISGSKSFTEALKKMGVPRPNTGQIRTLRNQVTYYNINYEHFTHH